MHEQDRDQHVHGEDESDGARENAEDQREPTEQFYGDDDPGGERGAGNAEAAKESGGAAESELEQRLDAVDEEHEADY